MAPTTPRFEHHDGPVLGIGTPAPRISWTLPAAKPDYEQHSYRLEVRVGDGEPQVTTVESADQVLVDWPVAPLRSRERATVRVAVNDGEWSEPNVVEAGLLDTGDWTARFISPAGIAGLDQPAPVLRGRVSIPGEVIKARLYITAHGLYEAELNGERVGDQQLTPGWTSYDHRLRYQTYDVTGQLRSGENTLEVLLGNGWFRGRLGFRDSRAVYGDRLALLAQLEVTTADGQVHVLATDGSWTARESQIVADDLYDGQHTDLRRTAGGEAPVEEVPADLGRLVAPDGPPVRITDVLPAVELAPRGDRTLVDFGQNLVGWVRLTVRGRAGQTVTLRHAEVLEHGELGVRPLRTAKATDSWILASDGEVTLEPNLTFHGFRYAEVTGAEIGRDDIQAVVVGSDLTRTGWFDSSHDLLNRFHENVVWGMRGNFVDVPTDCPQRDERLGWTGDIQVFAPTASFLFNAAGFLTNWLADLAVEQHKDGSVPFVIPDVLRQPGPAATGWGDAATLVPWVIYQRTGDVALLRRQLPSMRAWVDRMEDLAGSDLLWSGGFQFGDWLDPTAPPDKPAQAKADPDVIATAHFARSAEVVGQAAALTGDADTAARYSALADRVRTAFAHEYVTGSGRVLSDSATAYGLALQWALLPGAEQRRHAGERLADLIRTAGFRISTGFLGTPLMTDALTDAGEPELAYRLLLQTGCPSWLYSVTMGATTVWERWDSMLPDGSINPGQMTSFNHYALGAVADWMHRRVAGLAPAAPAYRELDVRPVPGRGLTFASARHLTPYGEAKVSWHRRDGQLTLDVTVPVGTSAAVLVPGTAEPVTVRHGSHQWVVPDPVSDEPLPADATIRQVLDHEPTWRKVVEAAVDAGVAADEAELAARVAAHFDAPASQLVDSAVPRNFASGTEEFRARIEGVLPS
ncbi:MAG TPA: family 78 glycoside hydrolase catalytic domain [Actinoplanes sp.]|nr:family 78 glycoside hydrolase catalytic domain [Actinoplanes sp.]